MSTFNYFFLTLDTTPPDISIYAPSVSNRVTADEIRVEASEETLDWQNIYAIDAKGVKHTITFNRESETEYTASVTFSGFPYGIATIFAQLQDTVGNVSKLATFNVNIIPVYNYYNLNMNLSETVRDLGLKEITSVTTKETTGILTASDGNLANLEIYDAEA